MKWKQKIVNENLASILLKLSKKKNGNYDGTHAGYRLTPLFSVDRQKTTTTNINRMNEEPFHLWIRLTHWHWITRNKKKIVGNEAKIWHKCIPYASIVCNALHIFIKSTTAWETPIAYQHTVNVWRTYSVGSIRNTKIRIIYFFLKNENSDGIKIHKWMTCLEKGMKNDQNGITIRLKQDKQSFVHLTSGE